jgi:hypothetical protein
MLCIGDQNAETFVQPDDLQYCLDLGLIKSTDRGPAIANPIYREIIPRELISDTQKETESLTEENSFLS